MRLESFYARLIPRSELEDLKIKKQKAFSLQWLVLKLEKNTHFRELQNVRSQNHFDLKIISLF